MLILWRVLVNLVSDSLLMCSLMVLQCLRLGMVEDFFGMGRVIHRAMGNQDKLAGLERRLVPQDAVLGDTHTI